MTSQRDFDVRPGTWQQDVAGSPAASRTWATRLRYARLDVAEPVVEYLHANGTAIQYSYIDGAHPIEAYQRSSRASRVRRRRPRPGGRSRTARCADSRRAASASRRHAALRRCERRSARTAATEPFVVPHATADAVNAARRAGRRVIAIGTTVVRALESAVIDGVVSSSRGWTDLVVTQARGPAAVDGILTGLHEPRASHFAMLSAFLTTKALQSRVSLGTRKRLTMA